MSKNIAQSGRPVALFGAGMGVPSNLEGLVERRYFSAIHYLALVCSDEELTRRLRVRPAWRDSGGDAWVESQLAFNRWFRETGAFGKPSIELLDTTGIPLEQTAAQVEAWIRGKVQREGSCKGEAHCASPLRPNRWDAISGYRARKFYNPPGRCTRRSGRRSK